MDTKTITELVSNLGFPIVISGVLLWFLYKTWLVLVSMGGNIVTILQKQTDILERLERVLLNGNHANSH